MCEECSSKDYECKKACAASPVDQSLHVNSEILVVVILDCKVRCCLPPPAVQNLSEPAVVKLNDSPSCFWKFQILLWSLVNFYSVLVKIHQLLANVNHFFVYLVSLNQVMQDKKHG